MSDPEFKSGVVIDHAKVHVVRLDRVGVRKGHKDELAVRRLEDEMTELTAAVVSARPRHPVARSLSSFVVSQTSKPSYSASSPT